MWCFDCILISEKSKRKIKIIFANREARLKYYVIMMLLTSFKMNDHF